MRLAGETPREDPEMFQTLWKHLKSDGVEDQAANQLAAEMMTHGEDFDSSIERYERYLANYKSKGFTEHAAQAMAVEALEGRETAPKESLRFARCVGDVVEGANTFSVPDGTGREDIAAIAEQLSGIRPERVIINGR